MFFDTMAGIVERHLPEFVGMMSKARIFRMESKRSETTTSEVVSKWEPDERTIENFRCPFAVVAIEKADSRSGRSGDCVVLSVKNEADRSFDYLYGRESGDDGAALAVGSLKALPGSDATTDISEWKHIAAFTSTVRLWYGSKKSGLRQGRPQLTIDTSTHNDVKKTAEELYRNRREMTTQQLRQALSELTKDIDELEAGMAFLTCCLAVLSVLAINEPASFVVEERPLHEPREMPKTIRRSFDRPHYIVLKPRQIRERFLYKNGIPDDERDDDGTPKVTPHERRGHYRRLQSERFKQARGQVLWIKPMWVGVQEAVVGGNRYKVRLDI